MLGVGEEGFDSWVIQVNGSTNVTRQCTKGCEATPVQSLDTCCAGLRTSKSQRRIFCTSFGHKLYCEDLFYPELIFNGSREKNLILKAEPGMGVSGGRGGFLPLCLPIEPSLLPLPPLPHLVTLCKCYNVKKIESDLGLGGGGGGPLFC